MAEEILFTPGQRLADPSGARDFGLYGAQPHPGVEIRILEPPPATDDAPQGRTAPPGATSADGPSPLPFFVTSPPAPDVQEPATAPPTLAAPTLGSLPQPQTIDAAFPQVTLAAIPYDFPLPGDSIASLPAGARGPDASGSDAPGSDAAAPQTSAAAIAPQTPLPAGQAETLPVNADPIGTIRSDLPGTVADAAAAASSLSGQVAETGAAVVGLAQEAAESLPIPIVTPAAGPILTASEALPDAVVGAVGDTAAEDVQDLAGADPAAGIGTLVGLVTAADMFDLKQADIEPVTTTIDPALGMLDTLAGDAPTADVPGAPESAGEDGGPSPILTVTPPASTINIADDDDGGIAGLG